MFTSATQEPTLPYKSDAPTRDRIGGLSNATNIALSMISTSRCHNVHTIHGEHTAHLDDGNVTTSLFSVPSDGHDYCTDNFYLSDLLPGSAHSFRIRGENGLGLGEWSESVTYVTEPTAPAAPTEAPTLITLNATLAQLELRHTFPNGRPLLRTHVEWVVGGQPAASCVQNCASCATCVVLPAGRPIINARLDPTSEVQRLRIIQVRHGQRGRRLVCEPSPRHRRPDYL